MNAPITDFVGYGHGWEQMGTTDFSRQPITRCVSPLCGAYVTDADRREFHDREFHLLMVGPHVGIGTVPHHILSVDGNEVGMLMQAPVDHRVKPVVYQWVVKIQAHGALAEPIDVRCDTREVALAEAGRIHPLVKWWGEGLHTSSWRPVQP